MAKIEEIKEKKDTNTVEDATPKETFGDTVVKEDKIREIIRDELSVLIRQNKLVIGIPVQVMDGRNIQLGKTTGTKIGTATDQKISVYGVAPITQRANSSQTAVSGTADDTYSTNEKDLINDLVTLTNELRQSLVNFGIIKGSN